VGILALELTITPAVVAAATLAARRFGPAVGGWLIGLPVTAGPVVLFLTLAHGAGFAARAATGLAAGVGAQTAFALGYAAACRRGLGSAPAVAAGTAAFAAAGAALAAERHPLWLVAAASLAALALGLRALPAERVPPAAAGVRGDLPLRMALATALVLLVTTLAPTLGPGPSGVATTYPLLSTLLAVFAHRAGGPGAAVAVFRGLLAGLFALMGFACTLALVLTRLPLAGAYALALALALGIQVSSLRLVRSRSPWPAGAPSAPPPRPARRPSPPPASP